MNLSIPNPVPTSGEIRIVRARLAETLSSPLHGIRTPVLAGVGAADLVVDTLGSAYQRVLASVSRPAAPRARA
ncbi:MAG TPA: hypothetical protein VH141_10000 [Pseudonocardia sp.]|jgi:hypothetical protein|nr:hypothetical protein [Pseudonocardia sp.]